MKYKIITPSKDRIESILNLCEAHALFERSEYSREGKAMRLSDDLFGSHPKLHCRVVEIEGEYVGYITWMLQYSTWEAKEYLYMDCLYLFDAFRGFGIGEDLVNEMKDFGKEKSIELIQWQTPDFNTRAIKFYKRIGATSKSKERFFLIIE